MMNATINQVRSFLAVAESQSFRRASETRHISASAISAHIRQLEDVVGVELFERTTREVRLTDAGKRFRNSAERAIYELDAVVAEIRSEAELQSGRVAIACIPTIASHFLPRLIVEFAQQYPGIRFLVMDRATADTCRAVELGEADFGIGPLPKNIHDLEFTRIAVDRFVAVVPHTSPLAGRREVTLQEVADHPIVTMLKGTNVRDTVENAFAATGLTLRPVYELMHHYTLGGMVQAGLGITILPSMAVSMLNDFVLAIVPIHSPKVTREIGVITRRGHTLTPTAQRFVELFQKSAEGLLPGGVGPPAPGHKSYTSSAG